MIAAGAQSKLANLIAVFAVIFIGVVGIAMQTGCGVLILQSHHKELGCKSVAPIKNAGLKKRIDGIADRLGYRGKWVGRINEVVQFAQFQQCVFAAAVAIHVAIKLHLSPAWYSCGGKGVRSWF